MNDILIYNVPPNHQFAYTGFMTSSCKNHIFGCLVLVRIPCVLWLLSDLRGNNKQLNKKKEIRQIEKFPKGNPRWFDTGKTSESVMYTAR